MKKQIVFVDDEAKVLDSLKRGLRSKRREWDMIFFGTGHEVIQYLEEHAVDVVVSDMLMPVMNGIELLEIVQKRWPATRRIVLSGELSRDLVPRVRAATLQQLSKPCSPSALVGEICRAIESVSFEDRTEKI